MLLDLFGTIVFLRPPPRARPGGWPVTRRLLEAAAREEIPEVPFERFLDVLGAVTVEIEAARQPSYREVSSRERFRRALERLRQPDAGAKAERLCRAHMRGLSAVAEMPDEHLDLLRRLRPRLRLGLVTNFDHGPTARDILSRFGLTDLFRVILISEEFGWRKPNSSIFVEAAQGLGLLRSEVVFVGDTALDDIHGARCAGIDAAWINRRPHEFPAHLAAPTFVGGSLLACVEEAVPDLGLVRE